MIDTYKAVCFDAGGTLLRPYPSVGHVYAEVGRRHGCQADADGLQKLFYAAWLERDALGADAAGPLTAKIERDWWYALVKNVFDQAGGIRDFELFFDELYDLFARPECWKLYPEVPEVLAELKARGKKLCIISNWDRRLFQICEGMQLDGYFDFILASAVFGAAKPSARIFEEALRRWDLKPEETVHVGDSAEDDVAGARAAGLGAILIDRKHHGDAPRAAAGMHLIHDLRELL